MQKIQTPPSDHAECMGGSPANAEDARRALFAGPCRATEFLWFVPWLVLVHATTFPAKGVTDHARICP
jgi:hypothetical protein